jgi:hypothetical protein
MAMAMNTLARASIEEEGNRLLLHAPWLDDCVTPEDPDAVVMMVSGADTDVPTNPDDDFSGAEPLWAGGRSLDACGEPTSYFPSVRIVDRAISAENGTALVPLGSVAVRAFGARADGTVEAGTRAADLVICAYALIADLGAKAWPLGNVTVLEAVLSGGASFGMPQVPGLLPDVDVDADGLERFVTDGEDFHIVRCIDGDGALLEGRDCWQDPRMADGFSLNVRMVGIRAVFAGREPDWADDVDGSCDAPADHSLFDAGR